MARRLDLAPHPEGGWFRETWRSPHHLYPDGYDGPRDAATAILFLLHPGERSRWHMVRSDELWLWHGPGALTLWLGGSGSDPDDTPTELVLGADLAAGQQPQLLVPGGCWQAAAPAGNEAVLVSCVVSPGFDFADFRLA